MSWFVYNRDSEAGAMQCFRPITVLPCTALLLLITHVYLVVWASIDKTPSWRSDDVVFGGGGLSMMKMQMSVRESVAKVEEGVKFFARGLRLFGSDIATSVRLVLFAATGALHGTFMSDAHDVLAILLLF